MVSPEQVLIFWASSVMWFLPQSPKKRSAPFRATCSNTCTNSTCPSISPGRLEDSVVLWIVEQSKRETERLPFTSLITTHGRATFLPNMFSSPLENTLEESIFYSHPWSSTSCPQPWSSPWCAVFSPTILVRPLLWSQPQQWWPTLGSRSRPRLGEQSSESKPTLPTTRLLPLW